MAQPLRILLIAEEAAGVRALRMLTGSPHQVVAVVTADSTGASVAGEASQLDCPVWPSRWIKKSGLSQAVRRVGVDLLLNVHALHVLPADLVAAPRIGSFNLHPGPLPRYAGLNAPSWAIYNGERSHAVTLHWMDAGIDTGQIAYQTELVIEDKDTGLTLSAKCVHAGLQQLRRLLEAAAADAIPRRSQPNVTRQYYGREVPQQGRLLWTESAVRVVNFVRACDYRPFTSPWGYPRAELEGRDISVLKVTRTGEQSHCRAGIVGRRVGRDVLVAAGDEWVRVQQVQIGNMTFAPEDILKPGSQFTVHPLFAEPSRAIA
jgi:methionyl-tRNA formyltransferase